MYELGFTTADLVFVVCTTDGASPPNLKVWGTASYAGRERFVTAGHVTDAMFEDSAMGRASPCLAALDAKRGEWCLCPLQDVKRDATLDISVFSISAAVPPWFRALVWTRTRLPMFAEIAAVGFPYAHDPTRRHIMCRGFRGQVVSADVYHPPVGVPFPAYELSIQVFRGLSGAPLLYHTSRDDLAAVGLVIGNGSTEMEVFSSKEVEKDGREVEYRKVEVMHVGIAIRSEEVLLRLDDFAT